MAGVAMNSTFGQSYIAEIDGPRITKQRESILGLCLGHLWLTLGEISATLDYPEASISAQLRHLRKAQFGGYIVNKRRRSAGTYEYLVLPPPAVGQLVLFSKGIQ